MPLRQLSYSLRWFQSLVPWPRNLANSRRSAPARGSPRRRARLLGREILCTVRPLCQLNSQLRTVSPRRQVSPPRPPLIESVPLPPLRKSSPARPSIWSFPPIRRCRLTRCFRSACRSLHPRRCVDARKRVAPMARRLSGSQIDHDSDLPIQRTLSKPRPPKYSSSKACAPSIIRSKPGQHGSHPSRSHLPGSHLRGHPRAGPDFGRRTARPQSRHRDRPRSNRGRPSL